jgi:hypothetical protein
LVRISAPGIVWYRAYKPKTYPHVAIFSHVLYMGNMLNEIPCLALSEKTMSQQIAKTQRCIDTSYEFKAKPASEILAKLECWYGVKIACTDGYFLSKSAITIKVNKSKGMVKNPRTLCRITDRKWYTADLLTCYILPATTLK